MQLPVLLISVEATEIPESHATQVLLNDVWGRARFQPYTLLFCIQLVLKGTVAPD